VSAKRVIAVSLVALVCFVGLIALDHHRAFAYVRARNLLRDAITRAGRTTPPNPDLVFLAIDSASVSLEEEADILFLPMTFEEIDMPNMKLCFPSKLADYTATRLPILIYAPDYCSAVQWARLNPGAAEVVTTRGTDGISGALRRLSDRAVRDSLGHRASSLGVEYFSYEAGTHLFRSMLIKGGAMGRQHE